MRMSEDEEGLKSLEERSECDVGLNLPNHRAERLLIYVEWLGFIRQTNMASNCVVE